MEQSHTIEETLAVVLVLGWFVTPNFLANPRCCKQAAKFETRAFQKRRETKRKPPGNGQTQKRIRVGEGAQSNAQMIRVCRGAMGKSDTAQRR